MEKVKEFVENHSKLTIFLIFLVGVLIYTAIASTFTVPVYKGVDEELYVNMARTFFFDGNFAKYYQTLNYNCVIYSMVLSIAYFFYSAKTIVFTMRFIGVILMISSVFPIYLITKEALGSKFKGIIVALVSLLIPEFTASFYLVQEVLFYPVFLWSTYLVYLNFTRERSKIRDALAIIVFAVLFFIKSYAIVFGAVYYLTLLLLEIKRCKVAKFSSILKKLVPVIIQGIICLAIIVIGILILRLYNGEGVNHYDGQIASIFPLTAEKIISFVYGIFFYLVFFLLCTGFLPVLVPIFNIKRYEDKERRFILYLILSTVFTIIEVSAIVFIPEEKGRLYPDKFCYRYLAVLVVPYMIMFLKCKKEDIKIGKCISFVYAISLMYLLWYYIGCGSTSTAIDAGMLFAIQQTIYYKLGRKFGVFLICGAIAVSIGIISLYKMHKLKNIKKTYIMITIIGLIILLPAQTHWHRHLSNIDNFGKELERDYVAIAENIKREYNRVYVIVTPGEIYNNHVQDIYGYIISDYEIIDIKSGFEREISGQKIAIIIQEDVKAKIVGANEKDINTKHIKLYTSEGTNEKLQITLYE